MLGMGNWCECFYGVWRWKLVIVGVGWKWNISEGFKKCKIYFCGLVDE